MSRTYGFAVLLTTALALPVLAAEPPAKDAPEAKEKMVSAGQLRGKLAKPPGDTITLSIQVGKDWKDFDFPVGGAMQVRLMQPPSAFDEKGGFKKYTVKELEELKGPNKRLPGYTGTLDDLKPGEVAEVYLVKKAGGPRPSAGKEVPPEYKPQVSMIVVFNKPQ